jgi:uncharacterized coiled-coil protein SlyX
VSYVPEATFQQPIDELLQPDVSESSCSPAGSERDDLADEHIQPFLIHDLQRQLSDARTTLDRARKVVHTLVDRLAQLEPLSVVSDAEDALIERLQETNDKLALDLLTV